MTSKRVIRHQAQRAKLKALHEHRDEIYPYRMPASSLPKPSAVKDFANDSLGELMLRQHQEVENFMAPVAVSTQETETLLMELRSRWDEHQMNLLIGSCKNSVLNSVVGPFGLGSLVAALDRNGGNVTTAHNAKQDIYARSEDEYHRADYAGSAYVKARDRYKDGKIIENSKLIQDEYSGDYLDYSQTDCDHIKPAKQYHQEGGFMQSKEERERFGAAPDNFAMTSSSGNRSLGDKDKKVWQEKTATDGSEKTNKDVYGHDNRRVNAAIARGEHATKKHAPTLVDKGAYYGERAVITGASEAGKMGLQQSIGLLLTEFFSASFDEIADAYKNGFRDSLKSQGFFEALRTRLARISERVAVRWREALVAFKEGAISGFLSNLVTMLINMLITTGKRIVRVIREGLLSIMKAVKMALFPPDGMTKTEAADAALKLLATGITVSLGILAEEAIEKSVATFFSVNLPILVSHASAVSAVFVGLMTGVASALLVYGLDKLDIFGVNSEKKHAFVLQELDNLIAESDKNITTVYDSEMDRMGSMLFKLQEA
jgi:hypothetical protein